MKTFVRTDENGVIIDVFASDDWLPGDSHVPDIAAQFVPCPAGAQPGGKFINGVLTAPEPEAPRAPIVPAADFINLFNFEEQTKIMALRQSDAMINAGFKRYEDPRVTVADLGMASTQAFIGYTLDMIGGTAAHKAERKITILMGAPQ